MPELGERIVSRLSVAALGVRRACVGSLLVGAALGFPSGTASAQTHGATVAEIAEKLKVIDRFRGTWNVTISTHRPKHSVVTSVNTNSWVLGNRFLQGDSGPKSDGTHDFSMMTYDPAIGGYPLWIFFSTGVAFFLPSGQWDEATQTMVWKSPPNLTGSYQYCCVVSDERTHRCTSIAKDWKGKVLLEQDVILVRRSP